VAPFGVAVAPTLITVAPVITPLYLQDTCADDLPHLVPHWWPRAMLVKDLTLNTCICHPHNGSVG
jgi:hypothetical protein